MNNSITFRKTALRMAVASTIVFASANTLAGDSVAATANAEVLEQLTVAENTQLTFGGFSTVSTGGTLTLAQDGSRTADGDIVLSTANAGAAGTFTVTGANDATYIVSTETTVDLIHTTDTAATPASMAFAPALHTAAAHINDGTNSTQGTLSTTGSDASLKAAGKLTVGTSQLAGSYKGTYNVTVEYN